MNPPETHEGVGDLSGLFVDHDALDAAELVAVGAINGSAFDFVAGDQRAGFPRFQG